MLGVSVGHACPSISHFIFANDRTLFYAADSEDVQCIKECLDKYELWCGQKFNKEKLGVYSRNVSNALSRFGETLGIGMVPESLSIWVISWFTRDV